MRPSSGERRFAVQDSPQSAGSTDRMKFCKAELGVSGAKAALATLALMLMAGGADAQQLPHSLRGALLGHKGAAEARRVAGRPGPPRAATSSIATTWASRSFGSPSWAA